MNVEQAIDYAQALRQSGLLTASQPGEMPSGGGAGLLTAREIEVAALIARELTNREIAQTLVIAEGTAANHVHHILDKLGLASRKEIAAWSIAQGLLCEPRPSTGSPT
jgi:DNA-binding NarL/FixJ family response regulator